MKLTLRWDDDKGEGYVHASEVKALVSKPDIATLDSLQDAMSQVTEIYDLALAAHLERGAAQLNAKCADSKRNEIIH